MLEKGRLQYEKIMLVSSHCDRNGGFFVKEVSKMLYNH